VDGLAARLRDRYVRVLSRAETLAERSGARFVHFLQPTLFTRVNPSAYEQAVLASGIVPDGYERAIELGYRALRAAMTSARDGAEVATFDLSDALDGKERDVEYYLDAFHVTHRANAQIATHMVDRMESLWRAGPGQPPRRP
jgi:hypothetical protein